MKRRHRQQYSKQYYPVSKQFTVVDFGGWPKVNQDLFSDGALFDIAQREAAK